MTPYGVKSHHGATHPTWTIVDEFQDIDVPSESHPLRTSVELWQVENVHIIQTTHPTWTIVDLVWNRCAFWIPPPEDQCGTVTGGVCVYHTATHPTWTIVDLFWNTCVFWIPPHEDQCGTLTGGDCVYHPDTHPTWTIEDLVSPGIHMRKSLKDNSRFTQPHLTLGGLVVVALLCYVLF